VKVYKYTPGQGENGSDFTLDWTDNFDTFNGSRWGKGDWTFDGNRVDLTDKNIYSKDGMLILALTRKGQESFNGQVPKDNEPQPTVSSSSQAPASSSSQQVNPPRSSSSQQVFPPVSSSSTTAIPQAYAQPAPAKVYHHTVNAKGARVKGNERYRVNFKF
ncbi:MAG: beta-glucanase, partial [Fibrobacter sp.]|nr:beta-glucanase [Fibrobacter sp.]